MIWNMIPFSFPKTIAGSSSRNGLRARIALLLIICRLGAGDAGAASVGPAPGAFENLGPQLTATTFQASTFAQAPDGAPLLCTMVRSQPAAKLCVIDARTGNLLQMLNLPGANGGWGIVTATDGSVYVGTESQGKLFRYVPGETQVHDLGCVLEGETFVWDLAAGKNGTVYGGTYPGGRAFQYTPGKGATDLAHGPVVPGESYARSVAYDPEGDNVYVGVGTRTPHLIELKPATGARRSLLPDGYADRQSVYSMAFAGGRIFAMIWPGQQVLVIDPRSGKLEHTFQKTGLYQLVSPASPYDGKVYYTGNKRLMAYQPQQPDVAPTPVMPIEGVLALQWFSDPAGAGESELLMFTLKGEIVRFHPPSGRVTKIDVKVPEQPLVIQSLLAAPDGRIWMSSYLTGGNAAFDPRNGVTSQYRGLAQSEKMTAYGSRIVFGVYPYGRLYEFDVLRPWGKIGENPRMLGKMEDQSRPVALVGIPELGKLFVGNVPEYGMLGGGLGVYDFEREKLTVTPAFIERQSISSLVRVGEEIAGGTAVAGGLGIEPAEKSAKLFLLDPRSGAKTFEMVPVPEAPIVSGLLAGPDRNVWGFAGGTLFIFDPGARKLIYAEKKFTGKYTGRAVWQEATMLLHPNGKIYGLFDGTFFRLDPGTKRVDVLKSWEEFRHTRPLALHPDGTIYLSIGTELLRYAP